MNKKMLLTYVLALITVVVLSGCTKDKVDRMTSLPIVFEDFSDNSKAFIDNGYACWENGDAIKITKNGTIDTNYTGSISLTYPNGTPTASASAEGFMTYAGDIVNMAYPLSLFSNSLNSSIGITMPSYYEYQLNNGNQKIESPMIGRVSVAAFEEGDPNPNVLSMTNLCCLLRIKLDRPLIGAFTLDSIIVVNTTKTTPMSGNATVSYSGGYSLSMTGSTANDRITLGMHRNVVAITETKYFYIPIPPQAASQVYKIYIHNKLTNNWSFCTFQSQLDIPGNSIATIQGPSTGDGDAIYETRHWLRVKSGRSAYIDLGIKPTNTSKLEMTFKTPNSITGTHYYSGARGDDNTFVFSFTKPSTNAGISSSFISGGNSYSTNAVSSSSVFAPETNTVYHVSTEVVPGAVSGDYHTNVVFEKLSSNRENVLLRATGSTTDRTGGVSGYNKNILIFAVKDGSVSPAGIKMYSYKISESGTLQYNFVPAVRTTDNAIGLLNMAVTPMTFMELSKTDYEVGND